MDFVIALVVLAITLAALAYPLYRARPQSATLNVSTLDDLLAQRDGLYATLRDLEADRQLGKLDEADYAARRAKYMAQASQVLQALDVVQGKGAATDAGARLEQEVRAQRKTTDRHAARTKDKAAGGFCRHCGKALDAGDKFCAKCGRAV